MDRKTYMTVETTNLNGCSCFSLQSDADVQNGAIVGKGDLVTGEKSVYAALDTYTDDAMYLVAHPAWSYKFKVANLPSTVTLVKGDFVEFKDGAYAKAASDTKLKVVDVEEIGFPYCIGSVGVVITGDSTNEYGHAIDTRSVKYTIEVQ